MKTEEESEKERKRERREKKEKKGARYEQTTTGGNGSRGPDLRNRRPF